MKQRIESIGLRDLAIDLIRLDGGTQSRVALSKDTVDSYAEAMLRGAMFPPITVFFDRLNYWLADGWHRLEAFRKTTQLVIGPLIRADVREGNHRDALLFRSGPMLIMGYHAPTKISGALSCCYSKILSGRSGVITLLLREQMYPKPL